MENFENVPENINTDGNRVKQILINLLSNAIKYTQQGFVKVVANSSFDGKTLKITVEDSGVGMSKD